MTRFRPAEAEDVPHVVNLLRDDVLGRDREGSDPAHYITVFNDLQDEPNNHLIVGETQDGRIVATYQITYISGLSLGGSRRAQVESVRVASALRGRGIGAEMVSDMRDRAAGCGLLQLTMNSTRSDTHRFYLAQGFVASHTGFKLTL
ncbi:MAG: GNAT family N-acetyltransferase [Pseudomonadota bacterium]